MSASTLPSVSLALASRGPSCSRPHRTDGGRARRFDTPRLTSVVVVVVVVSNTLSCLASVFLVCLGHRLRSPLCHSTYVDLLVYIVYHRFRTHTILYIPFAHIAPNPRAPSSSQALPRAQLGVLALRMPRKIDIRVNWHALAPLAHIPPPLPLRDRIAPYVFCMSLCHRT